MKNMLSSSIKSLIIGLCFGIGVIGTAAIAVTVSTTFNEGDTLSATSLNVLKTAVESIPTSDYIWIQEEQTTGTDGGDFNTGAWQTRVLNTEKSDEGGYATLSSNQITLMAGTYYVRASAPGLRVDSHQARLYNVTDGTTMLTGTSAYIANAGTGHALDRSHINGQITLAASKTLELQHRCETSYATLGLGVGANFGETEVFSVIELWRIGD